MIGPHWPRECMVLAITKRGFTATLAVLSQTEANGIAAHLYPDMAARIARSPFEENHSIIFLKAASTF